MSGGEPQTSVLTATRMIDHGGLPTRKVRSYRLHVVQSDGSQNVVEVSAPIFRVGSKRGNDLVIDEPTVSRLHFQITADIHGFRLQDLESTNGTFVDRYRTADVYLHPGSTIRFGKCRATFEPLTTETDVPASRSHRFGPLVGKSLKMREVFAILEKAAPSSATVLVEGETGCGKELVAEALHQASPRAGGPLVVFDCAAVPSNLVESELFGHERGAFTGATSRRIGRLEEADGGTLFIDELGELPLELQPKLLRALETREVRRIGSQEHRKVDIRIVAATNRDLAREVNRGSFREDLYYRLAVVRVQLPALRERREDIPLLVDHFVRRALGSDKARAEAILASISPENWKRLQSHPWPGNARQLKNVIERTLALSDGPADGIEPPTSPQVARTAPASGSALGLAIDLDRPFIEQKQALISHFEATYLKGLFERYDGNFSRAAAAAGVDRMYFKRLLKKYG